MAGHRQHRKPNRQKTERPEKSAPMQQTAKNNVDTLPLPAARFPYENLFAWYDRHGRQLPWRRRWPELAPAYHVWLSEIMLQQTVVATVTPYFLDFTRRWPSIAELAAARLDDVLAAWAGLGYYARARNLHKAAKLVTSAYDGQFPSDQKALLALPGVGPYTAGAISVIAFGQPGVVVDGNIERVMSRFFAIKTPLPAAKPEIAAVYAHSCPGARPSDFPQAMMDFANAVCTAKVPACSACPLAASCQGFAAGLASQLPMKAPKPTKPTRRGVAFVAIGRDGEVFLERRPDKGLLGGMLAFPSSGWTQVADPQNDAASQRQAPFAADWQKLEPPVHHVFTHFTLEMTVFVAHMAVPLPHHNSGAWQQPQPADLPSLMRKIWSAAKAFQPAR